MQNTKYVVMFLLLLVVAPIQVAAQRWKTYFSYDVVEQIARHEDEIFALSNGSLFSVNSKTEKIETWDVQHGLHDVYISMIASDTLNNKLLICYRNGKVDVRRPDKKIYCELGLYLKNITTSKIPRSITMHGGKAYMAMAYGVQVFDMQSETFQDTYYIGEDGLEVDVERIFFSEGMIYALTADALYSANQNANLIDYRNWQKQPRPTSGPLYDFWTSETNTTIEYNGEKWSAAGGLGVKRQGANTLYYKPDGPANNMPFRLFCIADRLYVLNGGGWAASFGRPAMLCWMENGKWQTIKQKNFTDAAGWPAKDLMCMAAFPGEQNHIIITSYGTGVYEVENGTVTQVWHPENSTLENLVPPSHSYICSNGVAVDEQGYVYIANTGDDGRISIMSPQREWGQIHITSAEGDAAHFYPPGDLIISKKNTNWKWVSSYRKNASLTLWDDGGTPMDASDDAFYSRRDWVDEETGQAFRPEFIYSITEDLDGGVWFGTMDGVVCVPSPEQYMVSDTVHVLKIMVDDIDILQGEMVQALATDRDGNIWIGTTSRGIYVVDKNYQILKHYETGSETLLPSNTILSLACNPGSDVMYVGTDLGLVAYMGENYTALDENLPFEIYDTEEESGQMGGWTLHFSYSNTKAVVDAGSYVYGVSDGALFSVDKEDEEVRCLNRLTGLTGTDVSSVHYDRTTGQLLVLYADGNIDLIRKDDRIISIPDLKQKQLPGMSKVVNHVFIHEGAAYMAMSFGILKLNLIKHEISDTYTLYKARVKNVRGEWVEVDGPIDRVAVYGDSIYAVADSLFFRASLRDNLVDYHIWKKGEVPAEGPLFEALQPLRQDTVASNGELWIAGGAQGIIRQDRNGKNHTYKPDGPYNNQPYGIFSVEGRLLMVSGGRWATPYKREARVMIYENEHWSNVFYYTIKAALGGVLQRDYTSVAIDPADSKHYWITGYGTGVTEFRNDKAVRVFNGTNSPLSVLVADKPLEYCCTEGATFDSQRNLWFMNNGNPKGALVTLSPEGDAWHFTPFYQNGLLVPFETPGQVLVDRLRPNLKWVFNCRVTTGVGLLDDGGTPFDSSDDRTVFYSTFIDQNGRTLSPGAIYSLTQDMDGRIWVGTSEGLFTIPTTYDFLRSNRVHRPIINRLDDSGLADYLLESAVITCMAHDGGNRHWIGTSGDGVYLITYEDDLTSAYTCRTIHHFTTSNSPIPSDELISLAIQPESGEVFMGTGNGLASFRSDASMGRDDFSDAYVYPNPVRPHYEGNIVFTGLKEDTYVKVTDAAGNVVFSTRSNGGTAVWNGKDASGRRVPGGVYRAFCNTAGGAHRILKVLIAR